MHGDVQHFRREAADLHSRNIVLKNPFPRRASSPLECRLCLVIYFVALRSLPGTLLAMSDAEPAASNGARISLNHSHSWQSASAASVLHILRMSSLKWQFFISLPPPRERRKGRKLVIDRGKCPSANLIFSSLVVSESLREYFSKYGEVTEVMVMKDPTTRRSR